MNKIDSFPLALNEDFKKQDRVLPLFRINPLARVQFSLETPYFISLTVGHHRNLERTRDMIHEKLHGHLGNTYSLSEVYGFRTYLTQVWIRKDSELNSLIRELVGLGNKVRIAASDLDPPHPITKQLYDFNSLSAAEVLDRLERYNYEPQNITNINWLRKHGVLLECPSWPKGIRAWCGLRRTADDQVDFKTQFRSLKTLCEEAWRNSSKISSVDLFMFHPRFQPLAIENSILSDMDGIISFIAKDFDAVSEVKECIGKNTDLRPDTFMETRKHLVCFQKLRDPAFEELEVFATDKNRENSVSTKSFGGDSANVVL